MSRNMNLTWLWFQDSRSGFCKALGSWGFLYTNPCIDPDQELAESSGRWEHSPFDHTVVMTSSRSSSLTLKSWNTVEVPQGIMSKYVNYSMYIEILSGGKWPLFTAFWFHRNSNLKLCWMKTQIQKNENMSHTKGYISFFLSNLVFIPQLVFKLELFQQNLLWL